MLTALLRFGDAGMPSAGFGGTRRRHGGRLAACSGRSVVWDRDNFQMVCH